MPATSDLSTPACIDAKPRMKLSVSPPSVSRGNNGLAKGYKQGCKSSKSLHGCSSVRRGEWVVGLCVVTFCRRGEVLFFRQPGILIDLVQMVLCRFEDGPAQGGHRGYQSRDRRTAGRKDEQPFAFSVIPPNRGCWGRGLHRFHHPGGQEEQNAIGMYRCPHPDGGKGCRFCLAGTLGYHLACLPSTSFGDRLEDCRAYELWTMPCP